MKGQVTTDQGRPVAGAFVALIGMRLTNDGGTPLTVAEGVTDAAGRYVLTLRDGPSTSLHEAIVIARADGLALAGRRVELERAELEVDLTMRPQQLIEVRLVDGDGNAAAKVSVMVTGMTATAEQTLQKPSGSLWFPDLQPRPKAAPLLLTSDANGRLTIPGVPAQHWRVVAAQGAGNRTICPAGAAPEYWLGGRAP